VLGQKGAAPRTDTADRDTTVQGYELDTSSLEAAEGAAPGGAVSSPGDGPPERERLNATILAGVEQCYDALRSKDVARVTELYRPTKKSDDDKLGKLVRILQTEESSAVVGERIDGARHLLGGAKAAMEFGFELVWKDAFGDQLASRPVFRAEFARRGSEWQISSCRMVGSPTL
jgi:hypothetical protein